jgi:hypothetical protein
MMSESHMTMVYSKLESFTNYCEIETVHLFQAILVSIILDCTQYIALLAIAIAIAELLTDIASTRFVGSDMADICKIKSQSECHTCFADRHIDTGGQV